MANDMHPLGDTVIMLYEPLRLVIVIRCRVTILPEPRVDLLHIFVALGDTTLYTLIFWE